MEFRDLERVAMLPVRRITLNPADLGDIRVGLEGDPAWSWEPLPEGTPAEVAAIVNEVPVYQDSAVPVGTIDCEGA